MLTLNRYDDCFQRYAMENIKNLIIVKTIGLKKKCRDCNITGIDES